MLKFLIISIKTFFAIKSLIKEIHKYKQVKFYASIHIEQQLFYVYLLLNHIFIGKINNL